LSFVFGGIAGLLPIVVVVAVAVDMAVDKVFDDVASSTLVV